MGRLPLVAITLLIVAWMIVTTMQIGMIHKRLAVLEQEEPKTISILATHKDGKYKVVDVWEED